MLIWLRFAFRNLLRNRRRSLYTILAVAIGFAAVNVFGGFTQYIFTNLRESFIYVQGNGHLSVFKIGAREHGGDDDPQHYLLSREEIQRIREIAAARLQPRAFLEVLTLSGLISNGDTSTIFVGVAWPPGDKYRIQKAARGLMARLEFFEGRPLEEGSSYGIGIGRDLGKRLGIGRDSPAILMAPTVHGQINALDAKVYQITQAPMELLEDKWVIMPLAFARSLYDTEGASQFNILLTEGEELPVQRDRLEQALRAAGLAVEVLPWPSLSPFYVKTERMFQIIFFFMFVIVSVIIVMSVVNTVSMSVLERGREIGTLRAMGAKRWLVVRLFGLEGLLLGLFGCLLGAGLFGCSLGFIGWLQPMWTPPQIARAIPLEVYFVPAYFLQSGLLLMLLSLLAGIFPARRIARRNIVEALGHV